MMSYIADFVLAAWIFSITYDWFHILINTFLLCFLFWILLGMSLTRAVLLSFSAHFFSFMLYLILGISLIAYRFASEDMTEAAATNDTLLACIYLGIVYATLQSLFLIPLHIMTEENTWKLIAVTWISNMLAALLSYWCIITIIEPLL
ncbi:MAG TPA: hypothetical protein PLU71_04285 [Candidatus Dependentiae bacterium]|nr:hypothetical protein [Candidatus Dependentiae bacterium]HRQ63051.1 hypothetical protein [Candidatus Dependentiae bacterium]